MLILIPCVCSAEAIPAAITAEIQPDSADPAEGTADSAESTLDPTGDAADLVEDTDPIRLSAANAAEDSSAISTEDVGLTRASGIGIIAALGTEEESLETSSNTTAVRRTEEPEAGEVAEGGQVAGTVAEADLGDGDDSSRAVVTEMTPGEEEDAARAAQVDSRTATDLTSGKTKEIGLVGE